MTNSGTPGASATSTRCIDFEVIVSALGMAFASASEWEEVVPLPGTQGGLNAIKIPLDVHEPNHRQEVLDFQIDPAIDDKNMERKQRFPGNQSGHSNVFSHWYHISATSNGLSE